ncbi:hypothetical protein [Mycobacterium sp.]|uniref:hypothetical protein n=1 Tax=Mycobacterium sp. TaxID=1785 RepID=UPI0031D11E5A
MTTATNAGVARPAIPLRVQTSHRPAFPPGSTPDAVILEPVTETLVRQFRHEGIMQQELAGASHLGADCFAVADPGDKPARLWLEFPIADRTGASAEMGKEIRRRIRTYQKATPE